MSGAAPRLHVSGGGLGDGVLQAAGDLLDVELLARLGAHLDRDHIISGCDLEGLDLAVFSRRAGALSCLAVAESVQEFVLAVADAPQFDAHAVR